MNEWQKIDINEIPYSEQSISKIVDILTKGYPKFSDYLDENFLNDLKRFQNQSPVKIYHPEDQKLATRLFEFRVAEYLFRIGANFTTTLKKNTLIDNYKKENNVKNINYPDFLITLDSKKYFVEVTMPTKDKILNRAIDIFNSGEECYQEILLTLKTHRSKQLTERWRDGYDSLTSMCVLYPELENKKYPLKFESLDQFSMKDFLKACSLLRILFPKLKETVLKQIILDLENTPLSTKILSGSDKDFKCGYDEYTFIYQIKNTIKNKIESLRFKALQELMHKENIGYILAISGGIISLMNRPLLTEGYFSFLSNETRIDRLLLSLYAEGLMGNQADFFFIYCNQNLEPIEDSA